MHKGMQRTESFSAEKLSSSKGSKLGDYRSTFEGTRKRSKKKQKTKEKKGKQQNPSKF
jgi:hypothetical protein